MKIAFIDFETTGLRADWHEIIEVGVVVFDDKNGRVVETFSAKVRPVYPQRIDREAQAINGYVDRKWADAPGAHETWKKFASMTKGCMLAAHNITFDYAFLQAAIKAHPELEFSFDRRKLDTISMAYVKLPGCKDFSLKGLCRQLGLKPEPKVHEALNGAVKGYELFKKLKDL